MALGVILLVKRKLELNKKTLFQNFDNTAKQNEKNGSRNELETKFRFPKPNKQKKSN